MAWITNWKFGIQVMAWIANKKFGIQTISHATYDLNSELFVRYSGHGLNSKLLIRYSGHEVGWLMAWIANFLFASHDLNKEPFDNQTVINHSNTELVVYSDPHCICNMMSQPSVLAKAPILKNRQTNY